MGKAYQGVFGSFVNKVGNVVGRVRQGVQIYSIYQPSVSNPQTPAQMAGREAFKLLTSLGSKLNVAIKIGFADLDGYKHGSPFSSFVGYNRRLNVVSGTYPSLSIDFSKVVVAKGDLANPFNLQGSVDSNSLTANWADNSGMGNALATDKAVVVVYNKDKNTAMVNNGAAVRSERQLTVTLPTPWTGDAIECWCFFQSAEKNIVSDSTYIGSFTI